MSELPEYISQNPEIGFGRTCIAGTGIPTEIISERFQAGESITELSIDYGKHFNAIEAAVRFELAEKSQLKVIAEKLGDMWYPCLVCPDGTSFPFMISMKFKNSALEQAKEMVRMLGYEISEKSGDDEGLFPRHDCGKREYPKLKEKETLFDEALEILECHRDYEDFPSLKHSMKFYPGDPTKPVTLNEWTDDFLSRQEK